MSVKFASTLWIVFESGAPKVGPDAEKSARERAWLDRYLSDELEALTAQLPYLAESLHDLLFRIGTDEAASAIGWDLDSLHVTGISNTPFS